MKPERAAPMTQAERAKRYRKTRDKAGLIEVRIWINPEDEPAVRAYDARGKKETEE